MPWASNIKSWDTEKNQNNGFAKCFKKYIKIVKILFVWLITLNLSIYKIYML